MKNAGSTLGVMCCGLVGLMLGIGCDSGSDPTGSKSEAEVARLIDECGFLTMAEASALLGVEVTRVSPMIFPHGAVCTYSVGTAALPQIAFTGISAERWKAYTSLDETPKDMLERDLRLMEPNQYKRLTGIGDGAFNVVGTGSITFCKANIYFDLSAKFKPAPRNSYSIEDTSAAALDCAIKAAKKILEKF